MLAVTLKIYEPSINLVYHFKTLNDELFKFQLIEVVVKDLIIKKALGWKLI